MEREYDSTGTLSAATVTAMYAAYTTYAAALGWALWWRVWPVPLPRSPAVAVGVTTAAIGAGATLAGMSRFDSAGQISATDTGRLHTGGIYRWSRNPQYLGNGLLVTGAAVAARSGFAGLLAAAVWGVYRRWIPFEERHLTCEFGGEYTTYQSGVRRWLGRRNTGRSTGG